MADKDIFRILATDAAGTGDAGFVTGKHFFSTDNKEHVVNISGSTFRFADKTLLMLLDGTQAMTGNLDLDGNSLILDADADSNFNIPADDVLALNLAGSEEFRWNTTGFGIGTNPTVSLDIASGSRTIKLSVLNSGTDAIAIRRDVTGIQRIHNHNDMGSDGDGASIRLEAISAFIESIAMSDATTSTRFGITEAGATILSSSGNNKMLIGNTTNSPIRFGTNNLERMVILEDGKVAIGIVTPTREFEVSFTGDTRIRFTSTGTDKNTDLILRGEPSSSGLTYGELLFGNAGTQEICSIRAVRTSVADSGELSFSTDASGGRLEAGRITKDQIWQIGASDNQDPKLAFFDGTDTIAFAFDVTTGKRDLGLFLGTGITATDRIWFFDENAKTFTFGGDAQLLQRIVMEADNNVQPEFRFVHNSSSSPTGIIGFYGNNASAALINYSRIEGFIANTAAGSEEGAIDFFSIQAGAQIKEMVVGTGLVIGIASLKGTGTINVKNGYFANGTAGITMTTQAIATLTTVNGIVTAFT